MQKAVWSSTVAVAAIIALATTAHSKARGETINGPLVVKGGLTVDGPLTVDGWLTIDCSKIPGAMGIVYTGKTTFISEGNPKAEQPGKRKAKVVNKDLHVDGPLIVHGPLTVDGQLLAGGNLTVAGLIHSRGCNAIGH